MEKQIVKGHEILIGSENIFADLGLPDADKLKLKSELVVKIIQAVRRHGLTQEPPGPAPAKSRPKIFGPIELAQVPRNLGGQAAETSGIPATMSCSTCLKGS